MAREAGESEYWWDGLRLRGSYSGWFGGKTEAGRCTLSRERADLRVDSELGGPGSDIIVDIVGLVVHGEELEIVSFIYIVL